MPTTAAAYVEVFSLAKDGSLDQQTAFVEHTGSSVHPQRQTKPYAHWFRTDPTNKFALAADLGTDEIVVYKFDATTGKLTFDDRQQAKGAARHGSAPSRVPPERQVGVRHRGARQRSDGVPLGCEARARSRSSSR